MPTHTAKAKHTGKALHSPKVDVKEAARQRILGRERALHPPKIDVKKAVLIAAEYFRDLFPAAAKANMMLEEIEEGGDGKRWFVTIGYDRPARRTMMDLGGVDRAYKTFTIDNVTGKVISVKIRSVA